VAGAITVTPATLTVTASSGTMTYGGAPPAIGPVYAGFVNGDSAAGSLTAQPVCSTTAASSSPVGNYSSTCSGGIANANYSIVYAPGTVTVKAAPLTVTANNAGTTYGAGLPAFNGSILGAVNGDTFTESFSTPATIDSAPGSYAITPSVTGARLTNYNVSYVPGVLTILPAPLYITADPQTKVLNAPNPVLTASYSGFVLGQGAAQLNGSLTCATTALLNSPVGSYPVTCSGVTSADYAISFLPGTLRVLYLVGACPVTDRDRDADHNDRAILSHVILDPIKANGTSVFHDDGALPVKFRVCDANGNSIGDPGLIVSFVSLNGPQPTSPGDRDDRGWHFDGPHDADKHPDTDRDDRPNPQPTWTYHLKLDALAPASYNYQITLNDGTTIPFTFTIGQKDRGDDSRDERNNRR